MTVTFDTHISSDKITAPLPFRSMAAIVSEKSTTYRKSQSYISCFVEIGPSVLEKKNFEGF